MKKKWSPRTAAGQIAVQLVRRYYLHDVGRDSAALTYYLLFALFPLLVFISTLLGILKLDVDSVTQVLSQIVPADVMSVLESYLEYVSANASRQLLWFSLIFSVWFPMRATSCLLHSLRKAFGLGPPRKMLINQLGILLFTVWLILTIGLTLLLVTVGRRALEFLSGLIELPAGFIDLWSYLRFIVLGVVMFLMLTVLYMLARGQRRPLRRSHGPDPAGRRSSPPASCAARASCRCRAWRRALPQPLQARASSHSWLPASSPPSALPSSRQASPRPWGPWRCSGTRRGS